MEKGELTNSILKLYICLMLFGLSICSAGSCGSFLPQEISSCTLYSTEDTYCCLLTTNADNLYSQTCYPINATDYLGLNDVIQLGDFEYKVNCGQRVGTTCGTIKSPVNYKDCGIYSLSSNSCCFIKYHNDTSCVWLGTPDVGEVEYNGLNIICSSGLLSYNYLLAFILLLLQLFNF